MTNNYPPQPTPEEPRHSWEDAVAGNPQNSYSNPQDNNGYPQQPAGYPQQPGMYPAMPLPEGYRPTSVTAAGVPVVQGNGRIAVLASLKVAFSQLFRNFLPWFLGLLATGAFLVGLSILVGIITGFAIATAGTSFDPENPQMPLPMVLVVVLVSTAMGALLMVFTTNGAIKTAAGENLTFGGFFTNPFGIGRGYLASFLLMLPMGFVQVIMELDSNNPVLLGSFSLATMATIFIAPLLYSWIPALLDSDQSLGQTLALSIELGKRNYGAWLAIVGLQILLSIGIVLTLGLGGFILYPVTYILIALAYRQAVGGTHELLPTR
ncbi:DUF3824 domain-containing protein [Corynebacterium choanae]|uniref:Integral membrane protein n=1 Tax=Corynebacterium choanae TaxID=1862358 RepID=A0A3G6J3Z3_9CORY|nr:DUF3824 domain-containing protein [Corynebacterium choanae]AZA12642.1 hypothetical protein CCHOA_01070 [Corynebacterium choanae]